jgi:hypothetical protein
VNSFPHIFSLKLHMRLSPYILMPSHNIFLAVISGITLADMLYTMTIFVLGVVCWVCSILLHYVQFCSIVVYSKLQFCSIVVYSKLIYAIILTFYCDISIMFYSILFYFIMFYPIPICCLFSCVMLHSILFHSISIYLLCFVPFQSLLLHHILSYSSLLPCLLCSFLFHSILLYFIPLCYILLFSILRSTRASIQNAGSPSSS